MIFFFLHECVYILGDELARLTHNTERQRDFQLHGNNGDLDARVFQKRKEKRQRR